MELENKIEEIKVKKIGRPPKYTEEERLIKNKENKLKALLKWKDKNPDKIRKHRDTENIRRNEKRRLLKILL